MKRKSSTSAWGHSTSSMAKGLDLSGPASGSSPLAVPVANSRVWEGKALPVLRASPRPETISIRPRPVPLGQGTKTLGNGHKRRSGSHLFDQRRIVGVRLSNDRNPINLRRERKASEIKKDHHTDNGRSDAGRLTGECFSGSQSRSENFLSRMNQM